MHNRYNTPVSFKAEYQNTLTTVQVLSIKVCKLLSIKSDLDANRNY